jgi:hypothetical protein
MRRLIPAAAALVVVVGAALAAGGVHAQQAGTIAITAPANNATVSSPVSVTVNIQGVTVKPAAEGDPNAYHYHLFIDVDPATVVQTGQPIVTGQANIIHTADLTVPIPNLAPGPHTVTAVLTKTDHVPLSPSVQSRVQFTVAGAAAGGAAGGAGQAATPRTGAGATADSIGVPMAALPAALLALGLGVWALRRRSA